MEQTEVMTEIAEETEQIEESEELKESENPTNVQNDTENEETDESITVIETEEETETETEEHTETETESESDTEESESETEANYDKLLSLINEINLNNDTAVAVDSEYQETVLQYLDNIQTYQQNLYSVNMTIAFFIALTCGILTSYVTWSRMR